MSTVDGVSILVNEKDNLMLTFLNDILICLLLLSIAFFYKLGWPPNRENQERSGNLGILSKSQEKWFEN